jgi:hypothetical protein
VRTPGIPPSCRDLDPDHVVKVFAACNANVGDAARKLHIPSADFRRFVIANPELMAAVFERVELRLDKAEAILERELNSDDPRYSAAAAFFVLRNTARAKRRGWITSSVASIDMAVKANLPPRQIVYRWRNEDDDKREAEAAEIERLHEEGQAVISIGWGDSAGGKTIEHEVDPEGLNKN